LKGPGGGGASGIASARPTLAAELMVSLPTPVMLPLSPTDQ
jgi:hypothetical protein